MAPCSSVTVGDRDDRAVAALGQMVERQGSRGRTVQLPTWRPSKPAGERRPSTVSIAPCVDVAIVGRPSR